ncbi:MAG: type I-B CRISPR-associated protein Cas7/Csh2 [bacterium]
MAERIKSRREILFLYDVTDANPNGDPLDENKPRIDEETMVNIVTDVRLKRTVRDYWDRYKGLEVFIKEIRKQDGTLETKEERFGSFNNDPREVLKRCIDIRCFGATTAVGEKTFTFTGPVQFKFGRSLHRVDLTFVKGTTVMPSGAERERGTFTERYILPYSLIAFYGVVNENTAEAQDIELTDEDVNLLLEAIWFGTKNLLTGSKAGQMPRLLLYIVHKPGYSHIGELDRRLKIESDVEDEKLRDISQISLNTELLLKALEDHKEGIEGIYYKIDERLKVIPEDFFALPLQPLPF